MAQTPPDFGPRTFDFACDIVRPYRAFVEIPEFPLSIARQILKAGTSIGANVEEGRAASSTDVEVKEVDELVAILTVSVRNLRNG